MCDNTIFKKPSGEDGLDYVISPEYGGILWLEIGDVSIKISEGDDDITVTMCPNGFEADADFTSCSVNKDEASFVVNNLNEGRDAHEAG